MFRVLLFMAADPKFSGPIQNATVAVGRDAILTCMVEDIGSFRVSTILEIISVKVKLSYFIDNEASNENFVDEIEQKYKFNLRQMNKQKVQSLNDIFCWYFCENCFVFILIHC